MSNRASSLRAQRASQSGEVGAKANSGGKALTFDMFGAVQPGCLQLLPGYAELNPTRFEGTGFRTSCLQHMGDRRTQEDRFLLAPMRPAGPNAVPISVFGVFDGTVGDFASDNMKDIFLPTLLGATAWRSLGAGSWGTDKLKAVFEETYPAADNLLLERCSRYQQHYTTCTSVTVLTTEEHIMVGHLGDSKIVLGRAKGDKVVAEELTKDHKPDQPNERKRIEESGGMVERLLNHNNKPFIRGGDFMMRKALGEQPMQLQYSRAFGAKDLKIFGMIHEPDVNVIPRSKDVRWLILASDGLWDVMSAQQAVDLAQHAADQGNNPCGQLVQAALLEWSARKARADNITCVCIQFD